MGVTARLVRRTIRLVHLPTFSIRAARPADLPLLAALELRAAQRFRESVHPYACELPPFDADELAELQRGGTVWVAASGRDELLGFAVAGRLGPDAYLYELDVEPAQARRGIGRALIRRVAEWARERADTSLVLSTFRDVPWNGPYYERLGFAVVPEQHYTPEMAQLHAREGRSMLLESRVVMRASLERLLVLD
jgi:GNAT superfamily N-acetyltransferase